MKATRQLGGDDLPAHALSVDRIEFVWGSQNEPSRELEFVSPAARAMRARNAPLLLDNLAAVHDQQGPLNETADPRGREPINVIDAQHPDGLVIDGEAITKALRHST